MAYTLQAIIMPNAFTADVEALGLQPVNLPHALSLLPLTSATTTRLEIANSPLIVSAGDRFDRQGSPAHNEAVAASELGDKLNSLCQQLSDRDKAVYIEAESWAGTGLQGCALYYQGQLIEAPCVGRHAINHALNWLGIANRQSTDAFDELGLGRFRATDDWLDPTP